MCEPSRLGFAMEGYGLGPTGGSCVTRLFNAGPGSHSTFWRMKIFSSTGRWKGAGRAHRNRRQSSSTIRMERGLLLLPQPIEAVTVYPGEGELLDVAVRLNNETECYGWDNGSYLN